MKPWIAGALMAAVAVAVSAYAVTDPPAYGLCVACHGRDLVGWFVGQVVSGAALRSPASGDWPLLTGAGLLIGAYLGARPAGEVRPRPARRPLIQLALGAGVMLFSLVALGCTTRLLLRAAYGDLMAGWSLAGAAVGVALATGLLAWRARHFQP